MGNIFLEYFKKYKFAFGVLISLVTSVLIVIAGVQYADIVIRDWIFLPLTGILFFVLMMLYTKIIEDKKDEGEENG